MISPEAIREIRKIIKEELGKIIKASITANQDQMNVTVQRFATDSNIPGVQKVQPFGLSSRAPVGTPTVIVPIDSNPNHLNTMGELDPNRPNESDGETILYDAYGHLVYLSETKMQFGSKASAENMVLGQVFKTFMDNLLTALQAETHIGNLGYPTSTPINDPTYAALQASPIDDETILSLKAFTER
jgi:hypothetical protein